MFYSYIILLQKLTLFLKVDKKGVRGLLSEIIAFSFKSDI